LINRRLKACRGHSDGSRGGDWAVATPLSKFSVQETIPFKNRDPKSPLVKNYGLAPAFEISATASTPPSENSWIHPCKKTVKSIAEK